MSLPKGSENPPKKAKWIKKGWVIKKIVNPAVCCCSAGTYPAAKCPNCEFYPCYADAYGSYRCPRCGTNFKLPAPTLAMMSQAFHPPKTCTLSDDKYHPYYPCYWDATTGTYRCPKCGGVFL